MFVSGLNCERGSSTEVQVPPEATVHLGVNTVSVLFLFSCYRTDSLIIDQNAV